MSCCALCARTEALYRAGAEPRAEGRLRVNRAQLRRALGGRAEVLEADAVAKASGRPSVNVAITWQYFTRSIYASGDLPVVATREALQNSVDAIRAAVKARQIRAGSGVFDVSTGEGGRTLSWEDNGIGMDAETILSKFLVLADSGKRDAADSGEAAGGFGVAKAVILGLSTTFRWEMATRNNLAVANGMDAEVSVFEAPFRQGTKITVHDLDPEGFWGWDRPRGEWIALPQRLQELLAANDLPELTLRLDGRVIQPMFSRRGGSRIAVEGSWGPGTTATVKAYRRPPGDRAGAYYVRLNGLFQFKAPARKGVLKADVVVDLHTTVRPGHKEYPLNAARDQLREATQRAFQDLAEEVEQESESVGRGHDDEVYDPESEDAGARSGARELGEQLAEAFEDPDVQQSLAAAVGGIEDYYGAQLRSQLAQGPDRDVSSTAPAGTKVSTGDGPERSPVLPPGLALAALGGGGAVTVAVGSPAEAVAAVRAFLVGSDQVLVADQDQADDTWVGRRDRGIAGPAVELALDAIERGEATPEAVATVDQALERATETAMAPGGGGLFQVAAAAKAMGALDQAAGRKSKPRNPFGKFAGLRISRKNYDRAKARRFKANYAKWVPHLLAWDATLRLVAKEARIRRKFKPGFVLDNNFNGLTEETPSGARVVYMNPDRLADVVKAHATRPIAIAVFLHSLACHELTHLDGRMGLGHNESFVSAREDLGRATGHLLPAIKALAIRLLKLPPDDCPEKAEATKLRRDLERTRGTVSEQRKRAEALQRNLKRMEAKVPAPSAAPKGSMRVYQTPRTRLTWHDIDGWLEARKTIRQRHISEQRHAAEKAHLAALPVALVETGTPEQLDLLEAVLAFERAPRGARAGHPTTVLLDAIDRRRAELRRGPGASRERAPSSAIVSAVAAELRANPPAGVDRAYVDDFFRRNHADLKRVVASALGQP